MNLVGNADKPGVRGVKVQMQNNKDHSEVILELQAHAVVVTTGGFSANRDLLQRYCPAVVEFPTTNGTSANGSGLELCAQAGNHSKFFNLNFMNGFLHARL